MSIKVMSAVWEHSRAKGSELLLLLAIADFADDEGRAFPSVPGLAKKIRMTVRGTQLLLRKLEKRKEVSVSIKAASNERNIYLVKSFHQVVVNPSTPPGESQCTTLVNGNSPVREPSFTHHKKKKHLAPDDWLCQWLKTQDILAIPFAFLDDPDWWAAASLLVTEGLDQHWLERQFAEMLMHFQQPDSSKPRTESGWKRFLKHWFKVADKIQQREKRQEKHYGTTR